MISDRLAPYPINTTDNLQPYKKKRYDNQFFTLSINHDKMDWIENITNILQKVLYQNKHTDAVFPINLIILINIYDDEIKLHAWIFWLTFLKRNVIQIMTWKIWLILVLSFVRL